MTRGLTVALALLRMALALLDREGEHRAAAEVEAVLDALRGDHGAGKE